MAIRFTDGSATRGQLLASFDALSATLVGSSVHPASRTGVLQPQLDALTGNLAGVFSGATNRTGVIGSALDGLTVTLSGTFKSSVSGPPAFAPQGPRSAFIGIAGVQTYTDPTQQARMSRFDIFVMGGPWEGWASSGRDRETIVTAVKAASTASLGTKVFNYQNLNAVEEDANDPYALYTAEVAARNWRLYNLNASGTLTTPNGGSATALVDYTTFVGTNPSGEFPYQFGAKYSYYKLLSKTKGDARFNSLNAGLAAPSLDGLFQDNFLCNPQVNGDWNRDGVTDVQGFPSCAATPWLQAGQLQYFQTMQSLAPSKYLMANMGDYGQTGAGVVQGIPHGALCESYMGKSWSWETQRTFAQVLSYYYQMLDTCQSPKLVMFGGSWPDTNPDGTTLVRLPTANGFPPVNTQWQWARYIACTAWLANGYPAINRYSQGYSGDLAALDWYDEYGGVSGLARNYFGNFVGPRPTTAYRAGLYRAEYDNAWVIVNPKGNGTQTILAADFPTPVKHITGTQDPTVNNGAILVSDSIAERDGRVYLKAPVGQLAAGHFVAAKMPAAVVHPRPDSETGAFTGTVYARHRLAYYDGVNPVQYECPIAIQGGSRPLMFSITAGPPGMTIGGFFGAANYGVITWTPTAAISKASPVTVTVHVVNQDGSAPLDVTYTLATSTSTADFIFLSPTGNDSTGNGTFGNPFRSLAKCSGATITTTTFPGARVYLRGGSYAWATQTGGVGPGTTGVDLAHHPIVYMAYPGETVTIDATATQLLDSGSGWNDLFYAGSASSRMIINGSSATALDTHTFEMFHPNRCTWWNIDFTNPINRANGNNTNSTSIFGFNDSINVGGVGQPGKNYWAAIGCNETGRSGSASNSMLLVCWFSVGNFVIENCNATGAPGYGPYIKDANVNGTVFNCAFDLQPEASSSGGGFLFGGQQGEQPPVKSRNLEICYSFIKGGAIKFDFQGGATCGPMYSYRNTVYRQDTNETYALGSNAPAGQGPFSSDGDVLISRIGPVLQTSGGVAFTATGTEVQVPWSGSPPPANCPINTTTGALVNATTQWRSLYLGTRGREIV